jgi:hypothetical protein
MLIALGVGLFGLGALTGKIAQFARVAEAQSGDRVFELRTYTAHPGRLAELHARFRDHTVELFERHGMTNVIYLAPQDAPLADNTLVYLLAHDSRDAAEESWAGFRSDPEWQAVAEQTRRNGPLVQNVDSVFLSPTDYSRMR